MKSLYTEMQCSLQIEYQEQRALGYWQLPICTPGYLLSSSINKNFNQKKQSVLNGNTVTEKCLLEAFFNQISEWCLGKGSWSRRTELSSQVRTDRHFIFFSSWFFFFFFILFLIYLFSFSFFVLVCLFVSPSFLSFLCFQFCNQLPSLCFTGINVICLSPQSLFNN